MKWNWRKSFKLNSAKTGSHILLETSVLGAWYIALEGDPIFWPIGVASAFILHVFVFNIVDLLHDHHHHHRCHHRPYLGLASPVSPHGWRHCCGCRLVGRADGFYRNTVHCHTARVHTHGRWATHRRLDRLRVVYYRHRALPYLVSNPRAADYLIHVYQSDRKKEKERLAWAVEPQKC